VVWGVDVLKFPHKFEVNTDRQRNSYNPIPTRRHVDAGIQSSLRISQNGIWQIYNIALATTNLAIGGGKAGLW
jgi:hypothetical protein